MLLNKHSAIIMAMLMLLSPLASAAYFDAEAGNRDVDVHYPNDGEFRTMHGHSKMGGIPFGAAFQERHSGSSADYFTVKIRLTPSSFYIRGAYRYSVFALPCEKTASSCRSINPVNRIYISQEGVSDGLSPLNMGSLVGFSVLDTAYLSDTLWGITFCTGLESGNAIYRVDDAACPGLLAPPPIQCPFGEY